MWNVFQGARSAGTFKRVYNRLMLLKFEAVALVCPFVLLPLWVRFRCQLRDSADLALGNRNDNMGEAPELRQCAKKKWNFGIIV